MDYSRGIIMKAPNGKWFRRGDIFVKELELGVNDSAENWTVVDDSEYQQWEKDHPQPDNEIS